MCRSEIENLADKAVVDVIGLVTFVGRTERVRSRANTGIALLLAIFFSMRIEDEFSELHMNGIIV